MAKIRRDHALRLLRVAARFGDGTSWGRAVEGGLEFGLASDQDRENSSGGDHPPPLSSPRESMVPLDERFMMEMGSQM